MNVLTTVPSQPDCPPAESIPGLARSVKLTDFDDLIQAFAGWDAVFRQLSRGAFSGGIQVVRVPLPEDVIRPAVDRVVMVVGTGIDCPFLQAVQV